MSDVYFFGHVSTGVILRLRDAFPAADGYGEVVERLENHAGEATAGALVLARLGRTVVIEGNWIGDNPECRRTLAFLEARGVDVSGLVVKPGYAGVTEIVISDGRTRTVFGRYCDLLFTTPQWEQPNVERLREARAVCVDPSFGETTLRVARGATAANLPLVSSDAGPDAELTRRCALMVVSNEFLRREFPAAVEEGPAREALFARYLAACPGLVVFTAGSGLLRWGRRGVAPRTLAPFKVEVVDSAGAGDAFRAALIHGLLENWSDADALRFANAVAALVCRTAPGCVNSPTLAEVEAFLAGRAGE
jgi:sulfofructose kinase